LVSAAGRAPEIFFALFASALRLSRTAFGGSSER
jgi:hypothetical protein